MREFLRFGNEEVIVIAQIETEHGALASGEIAGVRSKMRAVPARKPCVARIDSGCNCTILSNDASKLGAAARSAVAMARAPGSTKPN